MDTRKRKALEEAGWQFGEAGDFLGLSESERREVDLRVALCRSIRQMRQALELTQHELAKRLASSQSRVAKIEAGVDVSLDLMFRAFFALGGQVGDLAVPKAKRRRALSRV
jgi:DNA-binding XRE family transcriptional regulator